MERLEDCIFDIDIFIVKNRLKQNVENTELRYTYKAGYLSKFFTHSRRSCKLPSLSITKHHCLSETALFEQFY